MSVAPEAGQHAGVGRFQPQIRIGAGTRAGGGARVTITEGEPVAETGAQWQPLTRVVTDSDLAGAGLFEARVFDIAERGEALVIAKALHVREELHVSKSISEHVEQVDARLRHNEVEIESLAPAEAGAKRNGESVCAEQRQDAPAY